MTVLIRCDGVKDGKPCGGRYETNATTRSKCPYCGHSTRVRTSVIIIDPKIRAGYGETSVSFKRPTKQEFQREDYVEWQDDGVGDVIL